MGCFDESDQQKNNRAYHAVSGFDNSHVKDSGNLHTLYFKDGGKSEKVVATFLNSASGESEEVEMTKCGEDSDSRTFSCEGDVRKYNVASFDCNGQKTRKVAFNPCVSGWYKSKNGWMPYTQGKETAYVPSFEQVILDCNGYEKKIYFWTPDGYDPNSDEKYATIYVKVRHNLCARRTGRGESERSRPPSRRMRVYSRSGQKHDSEHRLQGDRCGGQHLRQHDRYHT